MAKRKPHHPIVVPGPLAARPDPTDLSDHTMYVTNEGDAFRVLDGAWVQIGDSRVAGLFKIDERTLAADAASIDFQAIPQTYTHLRIVGRARTLFAGTFDGLNVSYNGDVADANYRTQYVRGAAAAASAAQNIGAANSRQMVLTPGATSPANLFGTFTIEIPFYSDAVAMKVARSHVDGAFTIAAAGLLVAEYLGVWTSTAAINRVTLQPPAALLLAGTRVGLYGIKAAA